MNILNKPGFNLLERSLDAAALRQKVIADNVANVDTPNFKRSDVRFEELLQQEMNGGGLVGRRTNAKHIPIGQASSAGTPQIVQDSQTMMNNNLNNVDIDYEMALMAKNQLRYNVMVQQVNGEIKKLRTAIGGR
ncbi:flagellar basal body rod protein FlgB [Paenibacillus mucilaginosus]|uniref:Flagellar basal body rod protein FlgB n=3 Tax=Paenibacillus mucilaginosus TaxID=61624 RepID=H6NQ61_9BACL|nr:flagellar basal body rod protein FlgB [Paenibacillus mucilaginosus]AEI44347.1 Flagellar basal body protein [Paenibacillus mucilaginosus KNP414]AFC31885.1 Flagellar basal body protein [Paenibacillus mucilaginosus 3016]AFH64242.1 flagellar basal-body rod protein FlgB [Paenibacillus mucilaginosus K02]MCG7217599.1 flagellar basal body rod protein FlgB [Paenibacillus mucilaginosus]WDM25743.1 flagellar basal body rod protein FlgB [Paenibacillus mucilaginosus]